MSSYNVTTPEVATGLTTLDNTFGVMLIGALLSMSLWGITCAQTYEYFMNNSDDLIQRSIVAILWTITTLSSAMDSHMVYYYLVTSFANPSGLQIPTWSMNSYALVSGASNTIIRIMFARRVYYFGRKNKFLLTWIIAISTCDTVVFVILTVATFDGVALYGLKKLSRLLYVSFGLGVTTDLSVAIALCWLLQSSKTGFRRADSIVNVLMAYIVNTGALVVIGASVGLITYTVMPKNLIFFGFYMLLGKLYVNAYFASLNARVRLRNNDWDPSLPLSRLELSDDEPSALDNQTLSVTFQTTVERKVNGIDVRGASFQEHRERRVLSMDRVAKST